MRFLSLYTHLAELSIKWNKRAVQVPLKKKIQS